jgi:hypothetical protein
MFWPQDLNHANKFAPFELSCTMTPYPCLVEMPNCIRTVDRREVEIMAIVDWFEKLLTTTCIVGEGGTRGAVEEADTNLF